MVAAYRTAPFAASIALAHETSASRPGSVLAATLPVGVVRETEVSGHVDDVWRVEAGRETDPYLRIETSRGGLVRGTAAAPAGTDKVRLAVLVGSRRRAILPARHILERLAARRLRRLGTSGGAPTRRPVSE